MAGRPLWKELFLPRKSLSYPGALLTDTASTATSLESLDLSAWRFFGGIGVPGKTSGGEVEALSTGPPSAMNLLCDPGPGYYPLWALMRSGKGGF